MHPSQHPGYDHLIKAMELLEISPNDALRAVLSNYIPIQPGALKGSWNQRKNYGNSPTTKEIQAIFEESNFRCSKCSSRYRLTIDHVNDDPFDCSLSNLSALCFDCNRSKRHNGNYLKGAKMEIFKAFVDLYEEKGETPTQCEIKNRLKIKDLSGATYMIKMLSKLIAAKS